MKIAILVDGGFYLRRAHALFGEKDAAARAAELMDYCHKHMQHSTHGAKNHDEHLYRIFYYDCPPSNKKIYHPLLKKQINLEETDLHKWMTTFHTELKSKRKVAMRFGKLSDSLSAYVLTKDAVKALCNGKKQVSDLQEKDFTLDMEQKGVDMKIGLDIASLAYKNQVDQIILISGDSDFVPAAKLARREGIDFILDPMWATVKEDLQEHIDGLYTCAPNPMQKRPPEGDPKG